MTDLEKFKCFFDEIGIRYQDITNELNLDRNEIVLIIDDEFTNEVFKDRVHCTDTRIIFHADTESFKGFLGLGEQ